MTANGLGACGGSGGAKSPVNCRVEIPPPALPGFLSTTGLSATQTARPVSRELLVDLDYDHRWGFPCYPDPLCLYAVANTPAGPRDGSLFTTPSTSAFPKLQAGRLLHYRFRGLLSVHSRYGLQTRRVAYATLYTGGPGGFVGSAAAPIASMRRS